MGEPKTHVQRRPVGHPVDTGLKARHYMGNPEDAGLRPRRYQQMGANECVDRVEGEPV